MKHFQLKTCPHCANDDLVKNGKRGGVQRWYCKKCKKFFQYKYKYNAYNKGVKDQIINLTMNSSGIRDVSRILQISKTTVLSVLKKKLKKLTHTSLT